MSAAPGLRSHHPTHLLDVRVPHEDHRDRHGRDPMRGAQRRSGTRRRPRGGGVRAPGPLPPLPGVHGADPGDRGNSAGSKPPAISVRVGVLQYENADINGSTNNMAIKAAVAPSSARWSRARPRHGAVHQGGLGGGDRLHQGRRRLRRRGRSRSDPGQGDLDAARRDRVTPSDHTETARATIQGTPDFSPDASPWPCTSTTQTRMVSPPLRR